MLFTDGVSEAQDASGAEYGVSKLQALIQECVSRCPQELVKCLQDRLEAFRNGTERADDETLLAIQFAGLGPRLVV